MERLKTMLKKDIIRLLLTIGLVSIGYLAFVHYTIEHDRQFKTECVQNGGVVRVVSEIGTDASPWGGGLTTYSSQKCVVESR